jgi:hypothetical protein
MDTDNQEMNTNAVLVDTDAVAIDVDTISHTCTNFKPEGTTLVCDVCETDFEDKLVEMFPGLNIETLRLQYKHNNHEPSEVDDDDEDVEEDTGDNTADESYISEENSLDGYSDGFASYREHNNQVVRNILPSLLVIMLRAEGFHALCVLQFIYRAVNKYGYKVVEEYVEQRVCYSALNTLYRNTVEASKPSADYDIRIKYFTYICEYLMSIDLDQEKDLFKEFLRNKHAAYWNKILVACSAAFIIIYACALLAVIGYFK